MFLFSVEFFLRKNAGVKKLFQLEYFVSSGDCWGCLSGDWRRCHPGLIAEYFILNEFFDAFDQLVVGFCEYDRVLIVRGIVHASAPFDRSLNTKLEVPCVMNPSSPLRVITM